MEYNTPEIVWAGARLSRAYSGVVRDLVETMIEQEPVVSKTYEPGCLKKGFCAQEVLVASGR
jgi:hypothetical protein